MTEAKIKLYTDLALAEIVYLITDSAQIAAEHLAPEAILELLRHGWTATPF